MTPLRVSIFAAIAAAILLVTVFELMRSRRLQERYALLWLLTGLVVFVLAVNGALETWFTYNGTIDLLAKAQSEKADAVARRIQQFIEEIERQISFATRASATTVEQRRSDYQLLLLEVPAIERLIQLGLERHSDKKKNQYSR